MNTLPAGVATLVPTNILRFNIILSSKLYVFLFILPSNWTSLVHDLLLLFPLILQKESVLLHGTLRVTLTMTKEKHVEDLHAYLIKVWLSCYALVNIKRQSINIWEICLFAFLPRVTWEDWYVCASRCKNRCSINIDRSCWKANFPTFVCLFLPLHHRICDLKTKWTSYVTGQDVRTSVFSKMSHCSLMEHFG